MQVTSAKPKSPSGVVFVLAFVASPWVWAAPATKDTKQSADKAGQKGAAANVAKKPAAPAASSKGSNGGKAPIPTADSAASGPVKEGVAAPPSGKGAAAAAKAQNSADGAPATAKAGGSKGAKQAAPDGGPPKGSAEEQNLKLRDIEERVNQLKEKIFQSKARLIQLQEVVLKGAISGAKAVIIHHNEMGESFKLWRVQYSLDGAPIFNRVETGAGELKDSLELEVFNGSVAPGKHQLSVFLEYRGHGYGVFSYLQGYKFKIRSSYTFEAEEGTVSTIRIVGYEKGGLTTELKDRPTVRYDIETVQELSGEAAQAGAQKKQ